MSFHAQNTAAIASPARVAYHRSMRVIVVLFSLILWGCASREPADAKAGLVNLAQLEPSKLVDLSYVLDSSTVYWPTEKGFEHKKVGWNSSEGFWLAMGEFASAEHGGTHLDAPVHFAEGQRTVDRIPLDGLIGPAMVIDITADANRDADYRLLPADITRFERENGPILAGAIVVVRTGWGKRWPEKKAYLGSDVAGDDKNLHFPGISKDAATEFVKKQVRGVAIDTASLDHGPSRDFIAHRTLLQSGIWGIENLANVDRLPATGAVLIAAPMKIGEGSGAPVRVLGVLP